MVFFSPPTFFTSAAPGFKQIEVLYQYYGANRSEMQ
jgi:hypothetical protein